MRAEMQMSRDLGELMWLLRVPRQVEPQTLIPSHPITWATQQEAVEVGMLIVRSAEGVSC